MNQLTPEQYIGRTIDAKSAREFTDTSSAEQFFEIVIQRLNSVNSWQPMAGEALAKFTLVDSKGVESNRPPTEGDHFKIDIPGPGSKEGEGYDWVRVETVQSESDKNSQRYGFTVRPSPNPMKSTNETAHFYSNESTSTFLIKRDGLCVSVEIYDRNIKSNSEAERTTDKIRNSIVGAVGGMAFSKIQWQSLADGLITEDLNKT